MKKLPINPYWLTAHSEYHCPKCNKKGLEVRTDIEAKLPLLQERTSVTLYNKGNTTRVDLPCAYADSRDCEDFSPDNEIECTTCGYKAKAWDFIDVDSLGKILKEMNQGNGVPDNSEEAVDYVLEHRVKTA